nr:immunoglobulin heavy chain junction region [Mus musculus]
CARRDYYDSRDYW